MINRRTSSVALESKGSANQTRLLVTLLGNPS
jgi:hypothetical protein